MATQRSTQGSNDAFAITLAVVQFFFATTWTLYVIYLPQLAAQAGIGKYWIPWILVADQVVFAICDIATGFWVDRMRKGLARLGGWILGVTAVSAVAFLVLPYSGAQPGLLLVAILVWSITSSALRSPPWALLSRYAAAPRAPWLSALVLTGSALAAAAAPYLGVALRGVDPRLPFVLSTLTLLAAVGGLVYAERTRPFAAAVKPDEWPKNDVRQVALFFAALLVMGAGFQVHFSLNSAHQYLNFAGPGELAYLMPVFWIGFNLAMFPAGALVRRVGTLHAMALAAAVGAVASLAAALAPQLDALVAAQFAAGACWGVASVAAYSTAMAFGRTGHEGRFLGALFAVLAVAAFVRIAAYAADLVIDPRFEHLLPWLPMSAWLLAALLLMAAGLPRLSRA
jgi:MFS family permease